MPGAAASDEAWEAWSDAQEFEAMATGMLSRAAEPRDAEALADMRALLAKTGFRRLLGDRTAVAHDLPAALAARR